MKIGELGKFWELNCIVLNATNKKQHHINYSITLTMTLSYVFRYSSVQLLGDLLYRISGVTGKMTTEAIDEDDTFGSEESINCIVKALGAERKNRVLAGIQIHSILQPCIARRCDALSYLFSP